jgi:hypothetical protein
MHGLHTYMYACWVSASVPLCVSTFVPLCARVCVLCNLSLSLSLSLSLHLYVWQPLSITLSAFVCVCVCPQCLCTFVYTYLITHFFCKILFFKTAHGSYLSTTFSVHFFSLFPLRPNPADRRMNTRSLLTLILVSFDTDRSMNTTGPTA